MTRVAILIDGDNIGSGHSARIVELGKAAGRVDSCRAYANASNGSGWNAVPGVQLVHAGIGKNAADLLLSIDAVELALTAGFKTFVLASSDGDFSHLAYRLREHGRTVIGAGEAKAPAGFREACSWFEPLAPARRTPEVPSRKLTDLDRTICTVIEENGSNLGGVPLTGLGSKLKTDHNIERSDLPGSTLKAYLSQKPDIYDLFPREEPVSVRLTPDTRYA